MSNLKKIYIGAIVNRDLEVFEKIKGFLKTHYNVIFVDLLKKKKVFNVRSFIKRINKYPLSLIVVKLLTEESNQIIYNALRTYTPHIPKLNAIRAVSTCESRKETFKLLKERCSRIDTPISFFNAKDAYQACLKGMKIIIKLDTHNVPHLAKSDRIIGIAKTAQQFKELTKNFKDNRLFFQQYLGDFDTFYKVYVINLWAVTMTSKSHIQEDLNPTPVELVHMRVPLSKEFKRDVLKIGRVFRMPIFGVDYVLKDNKPYIVDVNDFPSFRHIPEAVSLISNYIDSIVHEKQENYKVYTKLKDKAKIKS